jgi:hypothetical protein
VLRQEGSHFHPISLVLGRGVIVACCLDCVLAFLISCVAICCFHRHIAFKQKNNCTSASLVVVTKGSLHVVSEKAQLATWDHYSFR